MIARTIAQMSSKHPPPHSPTHFQPLPFILLALAGALWGTGFFFAKIAFREMTVSENVAFRFIVGSLVLSLILLRRRERYGATDWLLILFAAAVGVPLQFLIQFWGLQLTTVSHASLIVGVLPVLLALSGALFLGESLHFTEWIFLTLSAAGAVLIAMSGRTSKSGPQPSLRGDLLVLASMFAAVVMILCTKHLMARYNALHLTATMIMLGTLMLFTWVELTHPVRFHFSAEAWCAVAAQGLLATAGAYLFWNWGLARVPASRASVFLNLEPLVGSVLGVTLLHERLGVMGGIGGLLIIASAFYFSRPRSSAKNAASPS